MLLANGFQVEAEVDQDLLGDDRRQEAVQGLLGAAVGVIGQVGQGVDQGACERRRIAHLEARLVRLALGGNAYDDLGLLPVGTDRRRRKLPS